MFQIKTKSENDNGTSVVDNKFVLVKNNFRIKHFLDQLIYYFYMNSWINIIVSCTTFIFIIRNISSSGWRLQYEYDNELPPLKIYCNKHAFAIEKGGKPKSGDPIKWAILLYYKGSSEHYFRRWLHWAGLPEQCYLWSYGVFINNPAALKLKQELLKQIWWRFWVKLWSVLNHSSRYKCICMYIQSFYTFQLYQCFGFRLSFLIL